MRLLLALALAACLALVGCETGTPPFDDTLITANDGTVLRGRVYGSGPTAVVMVHDFDGDQKDLESLAKTAADRGFTVLTYNMRGHKPSPGEKEVGSTAADAASAIRYVRRTMQRNQILLVGEGLGGTAVLKAASQEQVLGVVTISAYSQFRGLSVIDDIPRVTAPKLFIAAEGDTETADAARAFQEKAKGPSELKLLPGSARGKALREGVEGEAARDAVLDFLNTHKAA